MQAICPFCQEEQTEPSAAVSTFCRSCGEHFEMHDGLVIAPDSALISGIAAVIEPSAGGEMVRVPGTRKPSSTKAPPVSPDRSRPQVGFVDRWKKNFLSLSGKRGPRGTSLGGDQSPSTNAADPAPIDDGKRSVRCFDCGHVQRVSVAACSTQCGRCTKYISLENYEITTHWGQNIHTRGDVVIAKRGRLAGCEIACHDLTVLGELSATVDCSGDAVFRGNSRILGSMHCHHLRVDKKCKVTFPQGVIAHSVDVYGQLEGDIVCDGAVRIFKSGKVFGDATARVIDLKEGGLLSGEMNIQQEISLPQPPKRSRRFEDADN